MDYVSGQDRNQMMILSLDQLVGKESFVRVIDAFVDALDCKALGFKDSVLQSEGRPPFHPALFLKLYLYGYQSGIRSCRKLEHATQVNVEVMWLLAGRKPHYKTIANFRKDNEESLRKTFRHFVAMLKDWKLVDGKTVAVNSVKIRAQNSLKNNYNQKKMDRHLAYLDECINAYFVVLYSEDDPNKQSAIKSKLASVISKAAGYQKIEAQLEERQVDQISTTDSDAKAVVLHRNIVKMGYNIQAACCGKHKLLVAMDTRAVNDTHALSTMILQTQENLGRACQAVLADNGYTPELNSPHARPWA